MIDYELFEKLLAPNQDGGYIDENDVIEQEFFDRFKNYPKQKIATLFKKNIPLFNIRIKCTECGNFIERQCSRTACIEIFKHEKHICEECKKREEQEQELKDKKIKEQLELKCPERTKNFIYNFLDPNKSWKPIKTWEKINTLKEAMYGTNKQEIADYICNEIKYKEFLQTPYWKAISEQVRKRYNFKCQFCNSTANLNVHHKTYENHGNELYNIEDLVCICQDCHEKLHYEY